MATREGMPAVGRGRTDKISGGRGRRASGPGPMDGRGVERRPTSTLPRTGSGSGLVPAPPASAGPSAARGEGRGHARTRHLVARGADARSRPANGHEGPTTPRQAGAAAPDSRLATSGRPADGQRRDPLAALPSLGIRSSGSVGERSLSGSGEQRPAPSPAPRAGRDTGSGCDQASEVRCLLFDTGAAAAGGATSVASCSGASRVPRRAKWLPARSCAEPADDANSWGEHPLLLDTARSAEGSASGTSRPSCVLSAPSNDGEQVASAGSSPDGDGFLSAAAAPHSASALSPGSGSWGHASQLRPPGRGRARSSSSDEDALLPGPVDWSVPSPLPEANTPAASAVDCGDGAGAAAVYVTHGSAGASGAVTPSLDADASAQAVKSSMDEGTAASVARRQARIRAFTDPTLRRVASFNGVSHADVSEAAVAWTVATTSPPPPPAVAPTEGAPTAVAWRPAPSRLRSRTHRPSPLARAACPEEGAQVHVGAGGCGGEEGALAQDEEEKEEEDVDDDDDDDEDGCIEHVEPPALSFQSVHLDPGHGVAEAASPVAWWASPRRRSGGHTPSSARRRLREAMRADEQVGAVVRARRDLAASEAATAGGDAGGRGGDGQRRRGSGPGALAGTAASPPEDEGGAGVQLSFSELPTSPEQQSGGGSGGSAGSAGTGEGTVSLEASRRLRRASMGGVKGQIVSPRLAQPTGASPPGVDRSRRFSHPASADPASSAGMHERLIPAPQAGDDGAGRGPGLLARQSWSLNDARPSGAARGPGPLARQSWSLSDAADTGQQPALSLARYALGSSGGTEAGSANPSGASEDPPEAGIHPSSPGAAVNRSRAGSLGPGDSGAPAVKRLATLLRRRSTGEELPPAQRAALGGTAGLTPSLSSHGAAAEGGSSNSSNSGRSSGWGPVSSPLSPGATYSPQRNGVARRLLAHASPRGMSVGQSKSALLAPVSAAGTAHPYKGRASRARFPAATSGVATS